MPMIVFVLLTLFPLSTWADNGISRLERFMEGLATLRGEFRQSFPSGQGGPFREMRGTLALARPGRFRWEYTYPMEQVLVADGKNVWIYDPDLAQVTRRPLDQTLTGTPAVLLGSEVPLEERFQLLDGGAADGLDWVLLIPHEQEAGFEGIRLGFDEQGLRKMVLMDILGRVSTLEFDHLQRNVAIAPNTFRFTLPEGVDLFSTLE